MAGSTRGSTQGKYASIERKWLAYCNANKISTQATTNSFMNFLAGEFGRNLSYNYIKGYTAALTTYIKDVDYDLVKKLRRGMFNVRPPRPKYCAIWDVNAVLTFLSAMRTDTLMYLSQKLATLLMILSGNRVNMLSHMKLTLMVMTEEECTFTFDNPLKHSREGRKTDIMTFRAYPETALCPVKAIAKYVEIRGPLSGDPELFVTTVRQHHKASHDTLARWIKDTLLAAGIDTGTYQAHSCRAASTTTASLAGISLVTILKSASWANANTFYRYYQKEIDEHYEKAEENFGVALLEQYNVSLSS